ncbi:MAG: divalent-cation tolerance protein CutA [Aquificae bacterium]|nr:divalent-cation tolerance protein CutA [Aquificota bacterium]
MGYLVVFITCPDKETGRRIAFGLVENRLAACVNIIPGLNSIYFWQGKIEDDSEVLLVVKTRQELFEKLEKFVKENHPYTVPEIIGMPVVKGSAEYLNWIDETTGER